MKVAAAAGVGLGAKALLRNERRRERLRKMALGIRDTLLPPRTEPSPTADEAHAPGHRHLGPPEAGPEAQPPTPADRPWASHRMGQVHKARG